MSESLPEEDRELANENPPKENPYTDGPGEQEDYGLVVLTDADVDTDFIEVEE